MLNTFPSTADAEGSLPKLAWSSSSSFVALVSDQLAVKNSHKIPENHYQPSIITANQCSQQGIVIVVQQCQEVTGKLQVMGSTFVIERPHKIRKDSAEGDAVVIELTVQECVRVRFPDEATCKDFLKKFADSWSWWRAA
ncbi:uncharacterized protein LOC129584444 [Paramacrobiotus metropolitanus]|uniref:uncharacterized protein LOC129584444 n=1 Tax=Paramacrobiotus metropolitanus TaxID=2943436 RepID=UPI0024457D94|nr:uncharacterized protein LOC129584444 [Paramacrobiotus metropolitanus]